MYAKSTDTGIDPKEAAKRLNLEWDSAAAIEEADVDDDDTGVAKKAMVCSQNFHRVVVLPLKCFPIQNLGI